MQDDILTEFVRNAKTETNDKYMSFVKMTQAMTKNGYRDMCNPMETRDSGGACRKGDGRFQKKLLELEKEEEQKIQNFRNLYVARIENERNQEVRAPVEVRSNLAATAAKKIPEFEAEAARTYPVGSMGMEEAAMKLPMGKGKAAMKLLDAEANVATKATTNLTCAPGMKPQPTADGSALTCQPDRANQEAVGGHVDGHIEKCFAKHAREPGQPDGQQKKCDVRMSMNGKMEADIAGLYKAVSSGPNEMMSLLGDASTVTLDVDGSGLGECAELFKCIMRGDDPDYQ